MTARAFKAKLATKATLLALPIRSFRKKRVFCPAVRQQSLNEEGREVHACSILSFWSAVCHCWYLVVFNGSWKRDRAASEGSKQVAPRGCVMPVLETLFFFQRSGVEAQMLWGSCCLSPLHPARMCWVQVWGCGPLLPFFSFGTCQETSVAHEDPTNNRSRRSQGCVQRVPCFPLARGLLSTDGKSCKY